jgi:FMN phosphatase YigB (HAD superfamily)
MGVVVNEVSVNIGKTKEGLDVVDFPRLIFTSEKVVLAKPLKYFFDMILVL